MIKNIIKRCIPWMEEYKKIQYLYKKSREYYKKGNRLLSEWYSYKISKRYRCYISPKADISYDFILPHPNGVIIGEGVKIGKRCVIYQNVTLGRKKRENAEYPSIGDDVIIYSNTVIAGNVVIKNGAQIGCNSVVLADVEENSIAVGVIK